MVNLDKDDAQIDREELILRRENAVIKADREALNERLGKAIMKSVFGVAGVMMILSALFLMLGICLGLITLKIYLEEGKLAPIPLCIAIAAAALCGAFALVRRSLEKKNEKCSPTDALDAEYARLNEISKNDLGVPSDAKKLTVLGYFYDAENAPEGAYDVDEVTAFVEDGKLCLYHVDVVIAIPKESIEGIVSCKGSLSFKDWVEDAPYDSEDYAQYHIEMKQIDEFNEEYTMRGYCAIRFVIDGTPMEILAPLYQLESWLALLELEPTEE